MTARVLALAGLVLLASAGLLAGSDAYAQGYSSACRTARGVCPVGPALANSACRCYSDPGRIVAAPSNWSRACQVPGGQCQAPYAYPAGTPCRCGNLEGRLR